MSSDYYGLLAGELAGEGAATESREACCFWESHHETCRLDPLIPGSESCAGCPGWDGTELSGPIFIHSEPGEPDICGSCGIPADEHGAKCNEYAPEGHGVNP